MPGPAGLLLATVAVTVALSALTVAVTRCPAGLACPVDTARISLTGVQLGQAAVAVLAVLALSGEYGTGMIRVTFAAMPRRITVLAAKAALVTGLGAGRREPRRGRVAAGRAAHPARPRLHRGPRLPAAVAGRRAGGRGRRPGRCCTWR